MSTKQDLKVLVVEDVEEISAQMLAELRRKHYDVRLATNANDAMKIAAQDRPLMILTDLDLPTFEVLLHDLRRHDELKTLTVAIIDINHPNLDRNHKVKVLSDFDELDRLLKSLPNSELN
jgi:DNA-binding response OmpR family regulator